MFGLSSKIEYTPRRVESAADKAAFRNFGHASARISKDAKASITKSKGPSEPGEPPHTRARGGKNLRGAIRYSTSKEGAIIGPIASFVGAAGEAHEFGGSYRGTEFPERSFMEPALSQNVGRFADDWRGSIGE